MQKQDVSRRAVSSFKWTAFNSLFTVTYSVVYRIITSYMLELSGVAYLSPISFVTGLAAQLNNMGLGQAALIRRELDSRQFSTIFFFDVIKTTLLSLALFAAAGPIGGYYAQYPHLDMYMRILSASVWLNGASRIMRVALQRELRLDTLVRMDIAGTVLDSAVTISLLLMGQKVLAVVAANVAVQAMYFLWLTVATVKFTPYRFMRVFDRSCVAEMLSFSRAITAKQLFTYITGKVDELVIPLLFQDRGVLGGYFFAKDLLNKPLTVINQSVSRVVLSLFAKVNDQLARLSSQYVRITKVLALITFPLFTGMALTAGQFIPLLFPKMQGTETLVALFCISSVFYALTMNMATNALYALSRPGPVLVVEVVFNLLYYGMLYLAAMQGSAVYMAAAYVAYAIGKLCTLQYLAQRAMELPTRVYLRALFPMAAATLAMAVAVIFTKARLGGGFFGFFATAGLGALVYAALEIALDRAFLRDTLRLVLKREPRTDYRKEPKN